MSTGKLYLIITAPDVASVFRGALEAGILPAEPPEYLEVDQQKKDGDPSAFADGTHDLQLHWGLDAAFTFSRKYAEAVVGRRRVTLDPKALTSALASWGFEAGRTQSPRASWWKDNDSGHGWMFVMHGRRFVSERVVDRGPWRVLRAGDVTMIQFCDLDADEAVALEQATPGHALLAPVWRGGHYASQKSDFRAHLDGYKPSLYEAATRTSVVLVQEREVSAAEMSIAAATRVHQIFDEPVDQVRFVYFDEAMARKQLPELWLRGLEVHVMTPSGERRIDTEYEPPAATVPDWVKRLDG